jgi:hypothetical protein
LTAYSLRSRAGLVSYRQRSWDSPFGGFSSRKVPDAFPPERTHLPFLPAVLPPPKRRTGPRGRGSWVAAFRKSLAPSEGLARQTLEPPLGFALLGYSREDLGQDFSRPPLTRFAAPAIARQCGRRPRVSIGLHLTPSERRAEAQRPHGVTLIGFSHRLNPAHSRVPPTGLSASPRTGPHITASSPMLLSRVTSLYRSCRDRLRCRAVAPPTGKRRCEARWG